MQLQKLVLCIMLPFSLCSAMQEQPQAKKPDHSAEQFNQLISKKLLQLQHAVSLGGKASITELGLSLDNANPSPFTPRTKKALLTAKIIDEQGKIGDVYYLKLIYEDELLIEEIQGISRK